MNKPRLRTSFLALTCLSVLAFTSCETNQTASAGPPGSGPTPVVSTVQDLQELTQQAAAAYIVHQQGDADFAWSIAAGLRAYQTLVKTSADVKQVAASYSEGKAAGLTFAARLARLFGASTAPPPAKAAAIAKAIETVAADKSGP